MRLQRGLGTTVVGLVIVGTACGRSGATSAGAPPSTAVVTSKACQATVRGLDVSGWREIEAGNVRFCVPASWTGNGRVFQHGGGSVHWGLGTRPRPQVATAVATVSAAEAAQLMAGGQVPDSDVRRFSETIDGRRADMWRNRVGRTYHTGAEWASPRVWFTGESNDAASADLQVNVYRTIRFGGAPRD